MRERIQLHHSFQIPRTHPWLFISCYSPVIASIIAGSIIHQFSWFYIIIPGFFCFGVSCFLLDGLLSGVMTDNHGTAIRTRTPIRYWLKIGIWTAAYLFALLVPIGFALQEHSSRNARSSLERSGHP